MGVSSETHPFVDRIRHSLATLGWDRGSTVVAVSGGGDSIGLLLAMNTICRSTNSPLWAAHFNHGLRGPESDEDELFVRQRCEHLGIPVRVGRPSRPVEGCGAGGSLEHAARVARYRFLLAVAHECQAKFVLTAHTADDQVETVLFRVIRGTGLRGLAGIPSRRTVPGGPIFLRPLLNFWRDEVRSFLAELGEEFREDSSNRDLRFTRNRIRQELLPLLERNYHPGVRKALWRLSSLAQDLVAFTSFAVQRSLANAVLEEDFQRVVLDAGQLVGLPQLLLTESLRHIWRQRGWPEGKMSWKHWRQLGDMVRLAAGLTEREAPSSDSTPLIPRQDGEDSSCLDSRDAKAVGPTGVSSPHFAEEHGFGDRPQETPRPSLRQTFPGRIEVIVRPGSVELRWQGGIED
ncbi:MAG: tRNA lysidine(34) synthetase TilS [Thermoguttaceae bacterium]|nr:tRNA lysidine(34) synthetase TilS [Thermoguttaceae bacterium]MDW8077322.1 tRNA lysidine(34) synthetase TilS [Thermoguttaceae bacterium]